MNKINNPIVSLFDKNFQEELLQLQLLAGPVFVYRCTNRARADIQTASGQLQLERPAGARSCSSSGQLVHDTRGTIQGSRGSRHGPGIGHQGPALVAHSMLNF